MSCFCKHYFFRLRNHLHGLTLVNIFQNIDFTSTLVLYPIRKLSIFESTWINCQKSVICKSMRSIGKLPFPEEKVRAWSYFLTVVEVDMKYCASQYIASPHLHTSVVYAGILTEARTLLMVSRHFDEGLRTTWYITCPFYVLCTYDHDVSETLWSCQKHCGWLVGRTCKF